MDTMIIREAQVQDIDDMHVVRTSVLENRLSDPKLITPEDYASFITQKGKGWVCEVDHVIAGFAIADLEGLNIWALFVHPDYEGKGIGRKLHHTMMDWLFTQTNNTVWLGTAPATRAATFYRSSGWREKGKQKNGEIRFEMEQEDWKSRSASPVQ